MRNRNAQSAELGAGISRPLVLLLAFTCGAAVANLYYAQPLLHTIAHAFSVSNSVAGLLVTVTQAGYVVGLAGLAGALAAPVAGRLSDRGRGREPMSGSILLLLLSRGLLAFGKTSVVALIAGIVVLDLGAQAMHISNQSAVYSLHGQARSRLTTAYMVAYFSGGVALSAATSALVFERRVGRGVRARGGDGRGRADHVAGHRARDDGAAADRGRQLGLKIGGSKPCVPASSHPISTAPC